MNQRLAQLQRLLLAVEDGLLTIMLSAMVLLGATQILMRNLWNTGIGWGDPVLRILVLWIALLGAMVATRQGNHIRIDILSRYLPAPMKQPIDRLSNLFAALVCCLLAWHSGRFVHLEWIDGNLLFGSVPAWYCELILPVGFGVMGLRFLILVISGRSAPQTR